jgi:hypothetical protein
MNKTRVDGMIMLNKLHIRITLLPEWRLAIEAIRMRGRLSRAFDSYERKEKECPCSMPKSAHDSFQQKEFNANL